MTDYQQIYADAYASTPAHVGGPGSVAAGIDAATAAAHQDGECVGLQRAIEIADSIGHRSKGAKHVATILRSELAEAEVPR